MSGTDWTVVIGCLVLMVVWVRGQRHLTRMRKGFEAERLSLRRRTGHGACLRFLVDPTPGGEDHYCWRHPGHAGEHQCACGHCWDTVALQPRKSL